MGLIPTIFQYNYLTIKNLKLKKILFSLMLFGYTLSCALAQGGSIPSNQGGSGSVIPPTTNVKTNGYLMGRGTTADPVKIDPTKVGGVTPTNLATIQDVYNGGLGNHIATMPLNMSGNSIFNLGVALNPTSAPNLQQVIDSINAASLNYWNVNGNSNTGVSNFIGTNNIAPLNIKTNGQYFGTIDTKAPKKFIINPDPFTDVVNHVTGSGTYNPNTKVLADFSYIHNPSVNETIDPSHYLSKGFDGVYGISAGAYSSNSNSVNSIIGATTWSGKDAGDFGRIITHDLWTGFYGGKGKYLAGIRNGLELYNSDSIKVLNLYDAYLYTGTGIKSDSISLINVPVNYAGMTKIANGINFNGVINATDYYTLKDNITGTITNHWGLYLQKATKNYLKGSLFIGSGGNTPLNNLHIGNAVVAGTLGIRTPVTNAPFVKTDAVGNLVPSTLNTLVSTDGGNTLVMGSDNKFYVPPVTITPDNIYLNDGDLVSDRFLSGAGSYSLTLSKLTKLHEVADFNDPSTGNSIYTSFTLGENTNVGGFTGVSSWVTRDWANSNKINIIHDMANGELSMESADASNSSIMVVNPKAVKIKAASEIRLIASNIFASLSLAPKPQIVAYDIANEQISYMDAPTLNSLMPTATNGQTVTYNSLTGQWTPTNMPTSAPVANPRVQQVTWSGAPISSVTLAFTPTAAHHIKVYNTTGELIQTSIQTSPTLALSSPYMGSLTITYYSSN